MPEADLSDPGWRVWAGQALWKPGSDRPQLAGDILVAQRKDGETFVSFSKAALPLFTARSTGSGWWIEFVERGRSYSGRGKPPDRFVWFRMPDVLQGDAELDGWEIQDVASDEKILTNPRTGERVQMIIDP